MSFIKVTDPRKREALIKDFIETRKRIKDNFISRKVGETEYHTGLTKLFKPITETQKATTKEITEAQKATAEKITSELLPIKEGIEKLPAIIFPAYPSLNLPEEDIQNIGPIASKALKKFLKKDEADKTYGLRDENNKFYIGNKLVIIDGNDLIVGKYEYKGTPGLWELITSKKPDITKFTEDDLTKYGFLMIRSNALRQNYDPDNNKPLSSSGYKWTNILSKIWKDRHLIKGEFEEDTDKDDDPQPSTSGTGLTILPSDPNALIDRFDLLFTSQKAGHTGVRNEIISILDELKRQGVINTNTYKKLNSVIKK